jgi:hypothetical protein
MDDEGTFVAEICHIEATETGGERFNKLQTNEQRRAFGNLMLMCHRRHVKTNDGSKYPVPELVRMKATHEAKYSQIEERIAAAFEDRSFTGPGVEECSNLGKLNLDPDFISELVEDANRLAERLRILPYSWRQFLLAVIRRASERTKRGRSNSGRSKVNPDEVKNALGLSQAKLIEEIKILEDHHFAYIDDDGDDYYIYLWGEGEWERILEDILNGCVSSGIDPHSVLCDLHLSLLDS